jgi:uncharacterized membrane protein YhfC
LGGEVGFSWVCGRDAALVFLSPIVKKLSEFLIARLVFDNFLTMGEAEVYLKFFVLDILKNKKPLANQTSLKELTLI